MDKIFEMGEWLPYKRKKTNSTLVDIEKCKNVTLFYNIKIQDLLRLNSEIWCLFLTAGIQNCTRNGEEGLNVFTPTQSLENYQLNTALIEESMHWIL